MQKTASVLDLIGVTKRFAAPGGGAPLTAIGARQPRRAGEFVARPGRPAAARALSSTWSPASTTRAKAGSCSTVPCRPQSDRRLHAAEGPLLPWRSIANVESGRGRAIGAERRQRALRELQRCRLQDFAESYPYQLSGGMRQRAALARTLAIEPAIVLLDEPFSSLDAQTKLILQKSFAQTIASSAITTLLITHDLMEAVIMSDRILVMSERPGRIIEEIPVDLPDRDNPLARISAPQVREYVDHLLASLHLQEKAA
jgi:NitT/TauT family transport system ATP-binding protein